MHPEQKTTFLLLELNMLNMFEEEFETLCILNQHLKFKYIIE